MLKNLFYRLMTNLQLFIFVVLCANASKAQIVFSVESQNICSVCAVSVQQVLSYSPVAYLNVTSETEVNAQFKSRSLIVISEGLELLEDSENMAINTVLRRTANHSSFARQMLLLAKATDNVRYRLYFQMALDSFGKTSLYNSRQLPTYEIEKEVPHELWGFYQIKGNKAHVLLNEYQNYWNADYTLVHELFHLFDNKSQSYAEYLQKNQFGWSALDTIALEFRSVLAEVYYRLDVRQNSDSDLTARKDFRDLFIIQNNQVDHEKLLNYVLDLFYPVRFKTNTTTQLIFSSESRGFRFSYNPREFENLKINFMNGSANDRAHHFTEVVSDFFSTVLSYADNSPGKSGIFGLLFDYKKESSQKLGAYNQKVRDEILVEIQKRGARDVLDYLRSQGLLDPIDVNSIRKDKQFNILPNRKGGPSPRIGGGEP